MCSPSSPGVSQKDLRCSTRWVWGLAGPQTHSLPLQHRKWKRSQRRLMPSQSTLVGLAGSGTQAPTQGGAAVLELSPTESGAWSWLVGQGVLSPPSKDWILHLLLGVWSCELTGAWVGTLPALVGAAPAAGTGADVQTTGCQHQPIHTACALCALKRA